MPSSPFPSPSDAGAFSWLGDWIWTAASAAFGGGIIWGAHRSTSVDHARRLESLEKAVPDGVRMLGEKIDANHRDVMRMIVAIASSKRGEEIHLPD